MEWRTDWGLQARMVLTMLLLGVLYVVFLGVLWYAFESLFVVVVFFGLFSLAQLFFSDKLALWSMGAKEVSYEEYPELYRIVERLSQQADLPTPKIAVADTRTPNAFATGRSKRSAAVAVTTGLLDTLDEDELAGVVAHELAHVKNRDVVIMTIASFLSTIAFLVVRWGWLFRGGRGRGQGSGGASIFVAILASLVVWIVSFLLIRALSRYREYAADRGGAQITGNPAGLAAALLAIDDRMNTVPTEDLRAQAEMNAFFIVPIRVGAVGRLFHTHPSTEKRVDRLLAMERELEGR